MPIPPVPPQVIAAGIQTAGSLINAAGTKGANRKTRRWTEKMYDRQYQDNLKLWELQNEYNAPKQQMARFQDAGLNPHLIYGRGDSGSAGQLQSPNPQNFEYQNPEWGTPIAQASQGFYDLKQQQAQTDLLKAQTKATQQKTLLDVANTKKTGYKMTELIDTSLQALQASIEKTITDTAVASNEGFRDIERFLIEKPMLKQQLKNLIKTGVGIDQDNLMKLINNELRDVGINPNSSGVERMIGELMREMQKEFNRWNNRN